MKTKILLTSVIFLFLIGILRPPITSILSAQEQGVGTSNCRFTTVAPETQINPLNTNTNLIDPNVDPLTAPESLGGSSVVVMGLTNDFKYWVVRYETFPNFARLPVTALSIDEVRKQCRFSVWGKPNTESLPLDDYLELGDNDETHAWDLPVDAWHDKDYEGDGITIGILDTCYEGYQAFVDALDAEERKFPAVTEPLLIPQPGADSGECVGVEQHGTKVVQIVHRIAPKATFHVVQIHGDQGGLASFDPAQDGASTEEADQQGTAEPTSEATADATADATGEPTAEATGLATEAATEATGLATEAVDPTQEATQAATEPAAEATEDIITPTASPPADAPPPEGGEEAPVISAAEQFTRAVEYLLAQDVDIIVYAGNVFDPNSNPYYAAVYNATHNRNVLWVNAAGNIGAGYFYLESGEVKGNLVDTLDTFDVDRGGGTFNRLVAPIANMSDVRLMVRFPNIGDPGALHIDLRLFDQRGEGNVRTDQFDSRTAVYYTSVYSVLPSERSRDIRIIPGDQKNLPVKDTDVNPGDDFIENYLGFDAVLDVFDPEGKIPLNTKIPVEIIVLNALPARYEPTTLQSLPGYVPVPADMPEVLTVGSFEPGLNELAWNSSRSNNRQSGIGINIILPDGTSIPLSGEIKPDITAPNQIMISDGNLFTDTSTATPIVAGVAALLLERERDKNPEYLARDIKNVVLDSSQCLSDFVDTKPMRRVALPATVDATPARPDCPQPALALSYPQLQIPTGVSLANPINETFYRDVVPVIGVIDPKASSYIIELAYQGSEPPLYYYLQASDDNNEDNSDDVPVLFDTIVETPPYNPDNICTYAKAQIPSSNINVNRTLQMFDGYRAGPYTLRLVMCSETNQLPQQVRTFEYSPQLDARLTGPENGSTVVIADENDQLEIEGIANGGEGYVLEYRRQGDSQWRVLPGFHQAIQPADDPFYVIDQPAPEPRPADSKPADEAPDAADPDAGAAQDAPHLPTEDASIIEVPNDPHSEGGAAPRHDAPGHNICTVAQERGLLEKTDETAIRRSLYSIVPFDLLGETLYYNILSTGTYEIRLTLCGKAGDQPMAPVLEPTITSFTLQYQPTITLDPPVEQNLGKDDFRPLLGTAFGDRATDYVIAFKDTKETEDKWSVAMPQTDETFAQDFLCQALRPTPEQPPEATAEATLQSTVEATTEATAEATVQPTAEATVEASDPTPSTLPDPMHVSLPVLGNSFYTVFYDPTLGQTARQYIGVLCADSEQPFLDVSDPVTITYLAGDTVFEVDPQPRLSQYNTLHIKGSIVRGADFRYYVVRVRPVTAADESPWIQVVGPELQPDLDICALENDPEFWPYGVMGFPIADNQGINFEKSTLAMIQLDALPLAGDYEAEVRVCVDDVSVVPISQTIPLRDLPGTSLAGGTTTLPLYVPSETLLREIPSESAPGTSADADAAISLISLSSDRSWIQVAITENPEISGWIRPASLRFGAVPDNSLPPISVGQTSRRYVYASDVTGLWNIYSAQANNRNQVQLTNLGNNEYPSISPLGGEILFTSDRDGSAGVYLMSMDGTNQRKLTEGYRPTWSPNGRLILFESERDENVRKLFTYEVASGTVTQITTNGVGLPCCVSWAPNGAQIVYAAATSDGNYEIYLANIGGGDPIKLTDSPALDVNPSWQPGGNIIVFQSNRTGEPQIYRVNTDGTNLQQLTNTPGGNLDPSWSGGAQIIFSTFRNEQLDIYIMSIDGSQQNRLFADPAPDDETSASQ